MYIFPCRNTIGCLGLTLIEAMCKMYVSFGRYSRPYESSPTLKGNGEVFEYSWYTLPSSISGISIKVAELYSSKVTQNMHIICVIHRGKNGHVICRK